MSILSNFAESLKELMELENIKSDRLAEKLGYKAVNNEAPGMGHCVFKKAKHPRSASCPPPRR